MRREFARPAVLNPFMRTVHVSGVESIRFTGGNAGGIMTMINGSAAGAAGPAINELGGRQ